MTLVQQVRSAAQAGRTAAAIAARLGVPVDLVEAVVAELSDGGRPLFRISAGPCGSGPDGACSVAVPVPGCAGCPLLRRTP